MRVVFQVPTQHIYRVQSTKSQSEIRKPQISLDHHGRGHHDLSFGQVIQSIAYAPQRAGLHAKTQAIRNFLTHEPPRSSIQELIGYRKDLRLLVRRFGNNAAFLSASNANPVFIQKARGVLGEYAQYRLDRMKAYKATLKQS